MAKKDILLVDDDAYFCQFYGDALKEAGFDVDIAHNGEDGLKKIKENDYKLLIVDIVMPFMSGTAFLKETKRKKVPKITLTGLSGKTDKSDALKAGADKFLTKGDTSPADLVEEAKKIIK